MLLSKKYELPEGTRVRIIGTPDPYWNGWKNIVGQEGYIREDYGDGFIEVDGRGPITDPTGHSFYDNRIFFTYHSLEVTDLDNDPDGNY